LTDYPSKIFSTHSLKYKLNSDTKHIKEESNIPNEINKEKFNGFFTSWVGTVF